MPDSRKVLVAADLHWEMSPQEVRMLYHASHTCDLCVCLGDIPLDQLRLISRSVNIPIVGILGNHDDPGLLSCAGIEDIHGKSVDVCGIQIAGIGGCPRYKDETDRPLYTQEESLSIERSLEEQPPADLLICHAGPFDRRCDPPHRGFKSISRYMRRFRPAYVLHGHDHDNALWKRRYALAKNGRRSTTVICSYRIHEVAVVVG